MPPEDSSKRPARSAMAPVNAPRAWPNSSASASSSPSAAQLSAEKRRSRLGLQRWIARATSSFPLPLSPSMRTLNGDHAARCTAARSRHMGSLWPTRSGISGEPGGVRPRSRCPMHGRRKGRRRRPTAAHRHPPGGWPCPRTIDTTARRPLPRRNEWATHLRLACTGRRASGEPLVRVLRRPRLRRPAACPAAQSTRSWFARR